MDDKKAILILEDGAHFEGRPFGACGEAAGPVVLNTGVVGYQELITEPGNAGKILALTYPLIGNYGVNEKFSESQRVQAAGLVIKEDSRIYSNWQAKTSLCEFLMREKVVGITGVDTRTLAVKIREDGEMAGIISSGGLSVKDALNRLREFKESKRGGLLAGTSVKKIKNIAGKGKKIVVIDMGVSNSILGQLSSLKFNITLVSYDTPAKDILKLKPQGIIISSGPEDDPEISRVVDTAKELLGKVPMLGISTGHLVLAQATSAKVTRMKTGHRGLNYPVKRAGSSKGEITAQNHSLVVDESSLKQKDVQILERNINDETIEKLKSKKLKFISVQYYPASPGPGEVNPVFCEFMKLSGGKNA